MKAELNIGAIYQTEDNSYKCIGNDGENYVLQRITDNWTLTARECRFDDNGKLFWSGSIKGHWPKSVMENEKLYFCYRTGNRDKMDREILCWYGTKRYPTKTALLKAFNTKGYAKKVIKVLTAEQVLEQYPADDATKILSESYNK